MLKTISKRHTHSQRCPSKSQGFCGYTCLHLLCFLSCDLGKLIFALVGRWVGSRDCIILFPFRNLETGTISPWRSGSLYCSYRGLLHSLSESLNCVLLDEGRSRGSTIKILTLFKNDKFGRVGRASERQMEYKRWLFKCFIVQSLKTDWKRPRKCIHCTSTTDTMHLKQKVDEERKPPGEKQGYCKNYRFQPTRWRILHGPGMVTWTLVGRNLSHNSLLLGTRRNL